jgi:hypothetical protein
MERILQIEKEVVTYAQSVRKSRSVINASIRAFALEPWRDMSKRSAQFTIAISASAMRCASLS